MEHFAVCILTTVKSAGSSEHRVRFAEPGVTEDLIRPARKGVVGTRFEGGEELIVRASSIYTRALQEYLLQWVEGGVLQ